MSFNGFIGDGYLGDSYSGDWDLVRDINSSEGGLNTFNAMADSQDSLDNAFTFSSVGSETSMFNSTQEDSGMIHQGVGSTAIPAENKGDELINSELMQNSLRNQFLQGLNNPQIAELSGTVVGDNSLSCVEDGCKQKVFSLNSGGAESRLPQSVLMERNLYTAALNATGQQQQQLYAKLCQFINTEKVCLRRFLPVDHESDVVALCKILGSDLRYLDVQHFRFDKNQLNEIFEVCPKIELLKMDVPVLKEGESNIVQLSELKEVALSFHAVEHNKFFEDLANWKSLTRLTLKYVSDLSGSCMEVIAGLPNLTHLDLIEAKISREASGQFNRLTKLKHLGIDNCNFLVVGDWGCFRATRCIGYLDQLESLKLDNIKLEGRSDRVTTVYFEDYFKNKKKLVSLSFKNQRGIGKIGYQEICKCTQLEYLNLQGANIAQGSLNIICNALYNLKTFKFKITDSRNSEIEKAFLSNNWALLRLCDDPYSGWVPDALRKRIITKKMDELASTSVCNNPAQPRVYSFEDARKEIGNSIVKCISEQKISVSEVVTRHNSSLKRSWGGFVDEIEFVGFCSQFGKEIKYLDMGRKELHKSSFVKVIHYCPNIEKLRVSLLIGGMEVGTACFGRGNQTDSFYLKEDLDKIRISHPINEAVNSSVTTNVTDPSAILAENKSNELIYTDLSKNSLRKLSLENLNNQEIVGSAGTVAGPSPLIIEPCKNNNTDYTNPRVMSKPFIQISSSVLQPPTVQPAMLGGIIPLAKRLSDSRIPALYNQLYQRVFSCYFENKKMSSSMVRELTKYSRGAWKFRLEGSEALKEEDVLKPFVEFLKAASMCRDINQRQNYLSVISDVVNFFSFKRIDSEDEKRGEQAISDFVEKGSFNTNICMDIIRHIINVNVRRPEYKNGAALSEGNQLTEYLSCESAQSLFDLKFEEFKIRKEHLRILCTRSKELVSIRPCFLLTQSNNMACVNLMEANFNEYGSLIGFTSASEESYDSFCKVVGEDFVFDKEKSLATIGLDQLKRLKDAITPSADSGRKVPLKAVIFEKHRARCNEKSDDDIFAEDSSSSDEEMSDDDTMDVDLSSTQDNGLKENPRVLEKRKRRDDDSLVSLLENSLTEAEPSQKKVKKNDQGRNGGGGVQYYANPQLLGNYFENSALESIDFRRGCGEVGELGGPLPAIAGQCHQGDDVAMPKLDDPTKLWDYLSQLSVATMEKKVAKEDVRSRIYQDIKPLDYPIFNTLHGIGEVQPCVHYNRLLKQYQVEELQKLIHYSNHGIGRLISFEMGLGKTFVYSEFIMQMIARKGAGINLLLAPKSLLGAQGLQKDIKKAISESLSTAMAVKNGEQTFSGDFDVKHIENLLQFSEDQLYFCIDGPDLMNVIETITSKAAEKSVILVTTVDALRVAATTQPKGLSGSKDNPQGRPISPTKEGGKLEKKKFDFQPWVRSLKYNSIGMDEAQRAHTEKSNIQIFLKQFISHVRGDSEKKNDVSIYFATGTPFENKFKELWDLLEIINNPDQFKPETNFGLFESLKNVKKALAKISKKQKLIENETEKRRVFELLLHSFAHYEALKPAILPLVSRLKMDDESVKKAWGADRIPLRTDESIQIELSEYAREQVQKVHDLYKRGKSGQGLFIYQNNIKKVLLHPDLKDAAGLEEKDVDVSKFLAGLRRLKSSSGVQSPELIEGSPILKGLLTSKSFQEIFSNNEKAIVLTEHKCVAKAIKKMVKGCFSCDSKGVKIFDGDCSAVERTRIINWFKDQNSVTKSKLLILMQKVGGVGLNLPEAYKIFKVSMNWNPAVDDQAVARAIRIGHGGERKVVSLSFIENPEEKRVLFYEGHQNIVINEKRQWERFLWSGEETYMDKFKQWCELLYSICYHNNLNHTKSIQETDKRGENISKVIKEVVENINEDLLRALVDKVAPKVDTAVNLQASQVEDTVVCKPMNSLTDMEVLQLPDPVHSAQVVVNPQPLTLNESEFLVFPIPIKSDGEDKANAVILGKFMRKFFQMKYLQERVGSVLNATIATPLIKEQIRQYNPEEQHAGVSSVVAGCYDTIIELLATAKEVVSDDGDFGVQAFEYDVSSRVFKMVESSNDSSQQKVRLYRKRVGDSFHYDLILRRS